MSNHVLLNNIDHKDLHINTERSAELEDTVMYAPVYATEFRELQAHYPIVLHKDATSGDYTALALFGFSDGENLFLKDTGWDAEYIPMTLERQPFMVGFQGHGADAQTVIHIDMESKRISQQSGIGEPVFLEHGGNTPYLDRIANILDQLHFAHKSHKPFMDTLLEHNLIEPFAADITLNDGSNNRLAGFYIIHEENFAALSAENLDKFHKRGYIMAIHMMMASLSNFPALIKRKNALLD